MKNKGITLITMVITILVIIIIAGITFAAINTNNSVTEKGQIAAHQNSISQIEQWLNELYVENYLELPITTDKTSALIQYLEQQKKESIRNRSDNIFKIRITDKTVSNEEKWRYTKDEAIFYCLNIRKVLKEKSDIDVVEDLNDFSNNNIKGVYAVTSNLKVFFIVDWNANEFIGIEKNEINNN